MYVSDEWVFPEGFAEGVQLDRSEQFVATEDSACCNLTSPQNASEHHGKESSDHQTNRKEIFTFSSSPQSAPHGKSPNVSPESCIFPLDLKQDSDGVHGQTQIEDNSEGTDSSEEVRHFVHVILDKVTFILKFLGWNSVFELHKGDKSSFPPIPTGRFVFVRLCCLSGDRSENAGVPSVTSGQKKPNSVSPSANREVYGYNKKAFRKACIIDLSEIQALYGWARVQ